MPNITMLDIEALRTTKLKPYPISASTPRADQATP